MKYDHIVLGAGSGELLDVMGSAFSANGKKVIGASPSYEFVYSHVSCVGSICDDEACFNPFRSAVKPL